MSQTRLQYLFQRYIDRQITEEEKQELWNLCELAENNKALSEMVDKLIREVKPVNQDAETREAIFQSILSVRRAATVKVIRRNRWWYAAAAAIIILLGTTAVLFFNRNTKNSLNKEVVVAKDVKAPSINRATITLADGTQVFLDSANTGQVATEDAVKVIKLSDGKIVYQTTDAPVVSELKYNTLTNPRGSRVIDMTLADGSRVWLNAGSSITYPIAFMGNDRKVNINGEAYFEVAHDASKPFIVSKGNTSVQVLGTHFNVNAYDDEDVLRVTLLEGSVNVSNKAGLVKIKPGEQAEITRNAHPVTRNNIDVDEVMAWKNGLFSFKKADIGTIMRQVSRWYDVDVIYEGKPTGTFTGGVSRNTNVSNVLKILQLSDVHYRIEGKKITLLP